ncbi:MAG: hypothetical protein PHC51_05725 [bacterium]|nr:hypothetical protein [bacterium]
MKKNDRTTASVMADGLMLGHFVVANTVVIFGQVLPGFAQATRLYSSYPGLEFVYRYVDLPVCQFLRWFAGVNFDLEHASNIIVTFLLGETVILIATSFYGLFAYGVAKIAQIFVGEKI